jgi:hypothetical protein
VYLNLPQFVLLVAGHNITSLKGPCAFEFFWSEPDVEAFFKKSPSKERQWKNIENGAVAEESFCPLK